MKLTKEWMETWFDEFNRVYFDSQLPKPLLYVSHAKQKVGYLAYKMDRKSLQPYDYRLGLSTYYILTEWDYQNILLHEMIHLLIAHSQIKDTSQHGKVFRSILSRLNNDCGWDIHISIKTKDLTVSPQYVQRKRYLVMAIVTNDGRHILSVVNRNHLDRLRKQLALTKEIAQYSFYATTDAMFSDFPVVRTLRGKIFTADEYNHIIKRLQSEELFSNQV